MTVSFYGGIKEKFTADEKSLEMNGVGSVRSLIDSLGEKYGDKFKDFLLGSGTCFFLVNGSGIMTTGGLATKLSPGDKVDVLPFVDGG